MGTWIIAPIGGNCDCPNCGPTPCASGCTCDFSEFDVGSAADLPYSETWDVSADFVTSHDLDIEVNTAGEVRFIVKADGVTVYDSGCIGYPDPVSDSDTVTIPAGTEELSIEITQCSGSLAEWDYDLACA